MLRNVHITSGEVMGEFTDCVSELLDIWHKKMEELKSQNETERTKAHYTIKIIENFFNKRGGIGI